MSSEIIEERRRKRELLRAAGMDPYTAKTTKTHTGSAVLGDFDTLMGAGTAVTVAGRVMAVRLHGGSAFVDLFDGTEKLQLFLSKDDIGDELFALFTDAIDVGDFIEATGVPFVTKRETKALGISTWRVLTKSLEPIPSEHFGLKDEEARYRKRYLDILLNPELRDLFVKKAKFWEVTRAFMTMHGFLEVETPTIEVTTGGAEARPFKTYHNDFDMPVYMRICIGELWQKRLMAAGYPKTFEIGRAYRNEGSSPEHLQEFTNLEFYWAYADYRDGMTFVRDLYRHIALEVFGTTKFEMRGHSFDLGDEWTEIDYAQTILDKTGIDILTASDEQMVAKLAELGVKYEGQNRERLMDTLWKYCRKQIAGPAFLINHPKLVAPLAKTRPGTETVEMFQPIIAGSEVGRGYSELNDPDDQRARFEVQKALLDAGDEEAMMADWEFVEMLEHGMPPTCGYGFGDRLFAFLAGLPLRETQMFPLMKPKTGETNTPPEPDCEACES
ncbi:MAG: lysine--tRNA ligase [Candidatus Pacebacteria bacterium]|jgi:lysyl-tRNA synthetase class 2|nr:lysine--tRNA ligase [Candidatus Paceibacterota bacterium]